MIGLRGRARVRERVQERQRERGVEAEGGWTPTEKIRCRSRSYGLVSNKECSLEVLVAQELSRR